MADRERRRGPRCRNTLKAAGDLTALSRAGLDQ